MKWFSIFVSVTFLLIGCGKPGSPSTPVTPTADITPVTSFTLSTLLDWAIGPTGLVSVTIPSDAFTITTHFELAAHPSQVHARIFESGGYLDAEGGISIEYGSTVDIGSGQHDDGIGCLFWDHGSVIGRAMAPVGMVNSGEHTLACVYENLTLKLYIDNTLQVTTDVTFTPTTGTSKVGEANNSAGYDFQGTIYSLGVYHNALTQEQLDTIL